MRSGAVTNGLAEVSVLPTLFAFEIEGETVRQLENAPSSNLRSSLVPAGALENASLLTSMRY